MVGRPGTRPGSLSIMSRLLIQRFKLPAQKIITLGLDLLPNEESDCGERTSYTVYRQVRFF